MTKVYIIKQLDFENWRMSIMKKYDEKFRAVVGKLIWFFRMIYRKKSRFKTEIFLISKICVILHKKISQSANLLDIFHNFIYT